MDLSYDLFVLIRKTKPVHTYAILKADNSFFRKMRNERNTLTGIGLLLTYRTQL